MRVWMVVRSTRLGKREVITTKSQIKLGTVFGVELGLHYSWLVIALLITFSLAGEFHTTNRAWSESVVWSTAILTGLLFFACQRFAIDGHVASVACAAAPTES
jgi:hypothetical protein